MATVVGLTGSSLWAGCTKCGEAPADKGAAATAQCAAAKCDMGEKGKDCPVMGSKVAAINTSGLAALIAAKVPLVILDARSGKFDDGRRIPGAKTLKADAEEAEVAKLVSDKTGLIVTYCGGLTCPASNMLAERLKKLGYSNVIEYPQGIAGWTKDGNSIEGGGK
jgi:rhodanese-related sulfurtransferase